MCVSSKYSVDQRNNRLHSTTVSQSDAILYVYVMDSSAILLQHNQMFLMINLILATDVLLLCAARLSCLAYRVSSPSGRTHARARAFRDIRVLK